MERVTLSLRQEHVDVLDDLANERDESRSAAARHLLGTYEDSMKTSHGSCEERVSILTRALAEVDRRLASVERREGSVDEKGAQRPSDDGRAHESTAAGSRSALDGVDLPGTVDRDAAHEAILAAREFLRTVESAQMGEIVAQVMPDHPLGYDVEGALAKIEGDGGRYKGSWWRRVVKPGLDSFDDIEKPAGGRTHWRYRP
jgi:hypothetical protein